MKIEVWKPVVGYEGIYEVSNFGRVRSLDRIDKAGRNLKGRILKPGTQSGYQFVNLHDGDQTNKLIHRLVMESFVGPCPEGMEVCHYPDQTKSNNRLDNLMYGTPSMNRWQSSEIGVNCKPIRRSDGCQFESIREASRQTGIAFQSISAVCRGTRQSAGGFGWEFLKDE